MAQKDIIQELNDLQSSLKAGIQQPAYAVPDGYFESFSSSVLARVKAIQPDDSQEITELETSLKSLPFSVPQGYFDTLADSVMKNIRSHADYQTAREELESLSPMLNGISRKMPYSVPAGYFESFKINTTEKAQAPAKVVKMGNPRQWMRYAAAAVVIGVLAIGGILFFKPTNSVDVANSHAWVEQNMKKVSTADINNFVQLTNETAQNGVIAASVKNTEVNELLKDVSDKDIQSFLNETDLNEENSSDDLFLN